MNTIKIREYESPVGTLLLGSFNDKLCICDWQNNKHRTAADNKLKRVLNVELREGTSQVIEQAASELDEYFAGKRCEFDVPLMFVGTEFQKKVWNELLHIPYGTTISYSEIARRIGKPKAVRAVANAIGANRISIFAPCHRIIGSNGYITGYAGGLHAKHFLLSLESLYKTNLLPAFSS